MYLQGGAIWHPRCGPGPTENGQILNGSGEPNGHCTDTDASVREFDRMSSSGVSEMQVLVVLHRNFDFPVFCLPFSSFYFFCMVFSSSPCALAPLA